MKKIFLTLAASIVAFSLCFAQKNSAADKTKIIQEQAGRPDVPGDLFMETGFNILMDDEVMNTKLWGSKIFNFYYQYGKNIGDSRFSIHPGIGIGTEKYAFNDTATLYSAVVQNKVVNELVRIDSLYPNASDFRKTKLATTYLDIPVEIRWRSLKYDPKRSLKIALGAKIGFMLDAHTKVKYDEAGEKKIRKQKADFGLNKVRYGVYGKVGYGNAYLFYYYSLTTLFDGSSGPQGTEAFPVMFGISLSVF